MITIDELRQKHSIHSELAVLTGVIQVKVKGAILGTEPHYATIGCPKLQFDPAGELLLDNSVGQNGAAIEAYFTRQSVAPDIQALLSCEGSPNNMIHLLFGQKNTPPHPAAAKVLKEAGDLFKAREGQPLFLVALPIFYSGKGAGSGSYVGGRLRPFGLFDQAGEALWINPEAQTVSVDVKGTKLMKADFPATQKQRSVTVIAPPVVAPPAAPEAHWYDKLSEVYAKSYKSSGMNLHQFVLAKRADRLLENGQAPTKTEAMKLARAEYAEYAAAKAPATTEPEPVPLPSLSKPRLTQARV
jgi:hypothetical protein